MLVDEGMETIMDGTAPISVYITSASRDDALREELEKHLELLVKHNQICIWHRHKTPLGAHAQQEKEAHLATAAIILFLVSADFLRECDAEIRHALARHIAGTAIVIPIMIRAVDLENAPFAHLQCLPRSGPPVTECQSLDKVFQVISTEIRTVVASCASSQQRTSEERVLMKPSKYQISADQIQEQTIGNANAVTKYLTTGIAELPTDYAIRIQNFIIEYLGTSKRPVPFGGRERDLVRLNMWLDDSNVPPYLLIVGPAGRGKSALLVRWSQQLAERDDLVVAFLPVSIRFRTNLASVVFASLTARLASLHGEKLSAALDTPLEIWRGLMTDYLARPLPDGRRLLLILDGVDEAADWEVGPDLFSLAPPPGIHIILSARYLVGDISPKSWLYRIGWDRSHLADTIDLNPLTHEGVADVLRHMNFPLYHLGTRRDIVTELHRLSEGDPLLVRLYVDDLWDRGEGATRLRPEDLRTIRPGLQGYFDRWWEDQRRLWGDQRPLREPAVQALLNLLACALGPLDRNAILRLAPSKVDLTTWALEEALRPLQRIVIGDGRHQGYTFSHPRLGIYFYELLAEQEHQAVESRFLAWGRETLTALKEGLLRPEQAPSYIVQYYGAHLERTNGDTETLLSLVSNNWRRAWEVLEGEYAGFLNDTLRAWKSAEKRDKELIEAGLSAIYLGNEIRCALCLSSVRSLTTNIPPLLLLEVVKRGILSPAQGLSYARQIPDLGQRAKALALLAPFVSNPLPTEILQEALEIAYSIEYKKEQVEVLTELVPLLLGNQKREGLYEALKTARSIEDIGLRTEGLSEVIPQLAELGYIQEALQVVWLMKLEYWQAKSLVKLAPVLPESLLREVLRMAQMIEDESCQAEILGAVIPRLAEVGYPHEALMAVHKIRYSISQAKILIELAPFLDEPLLQEALEIAQTIKNTEYQIEAKVSLIPYTPNLSGYNAIELVKSIKDKEKQITILINIISLLPKMLKDEITSEIQKAIVSLSVEKQVKALISLTSNVPDDLQRKIFPEAMKAIVSLSVEKQVKALISLTSNVPDDLQRKIFPEILKALQAIKDEMEIYDIEDFLELIPSLARLVDAQEMLEIVQAIDDKEDRMSALTILAPYLPDISLRQALDSTRAIEDEVAQGKTLVELALFLPDPLLQDVLTVVQKIKSEYWRIQLLQKLVPVLPEPLMQGALQTAQGIEDKESQFSLMAELASQFIKLGHPKKALKIALKLKTEPGKEEPLVRLAIQLGEIGYSPEGLKVAKTIKSEDYRTKALIGLIPFLPKSLLIEMFKSIQTAKDEKSQVEILVELASQLTELGHTKIALETVRALKEAKYLPKVPLAKLSTMLVEAGHFQEALDTAKKTSDEKYYFETLVELAPSLPEPLLQEVLKIVKAFQSKEYQIRALVELAPSLPEPLLQEVLKIVKAFQDKELQIRALVELAPLLPEPLLQKALDSMEKLSRNIFLKNYKTVYWPSGNELLLKLAPFLQGTFLQDISRLLLENKDIEDRVNTLIRLIPVLPEHLKDNVAQETLKATWTLEDVEDRIRSLAYLVPVLPENMKNSVVQEILEIVQVMKDDRFGIATLAEVAPSLTQWGYPQVILGIAQAMINDDYGVEDLVELILSLVRLGYPKEAFEIAKMIDYDMPKQELMELISSLARLGHFSEALEAAQTIEGEESQIEALVKLVQTLPIELILEMLNALHVIQNEEVSTAIMLEISSRLLKDKSPQAALKMIIHKINNIDKQIIMDDETIIEDLWVNKLADVASHLAKLPIVTLYPLWRQVLRTLAYRSRQDLLVDLAALAPVILSTGEKKAIAETYRSILEVGQWWP